MTPRTGNTDAKIAAMSDEAFERWMKRKGLTGLAAFAMSRKRAALRATPKGPYIETPPDAGRIAEVLRSTVPTPTPDTDR